MNYIQTTLAIKELHIPKKCNSICISCNKPAYIKVSFKEETITPKWFCKNCFNQNFRIKKTT